MDENKEHPGDEFSPTEITKAEELTKTLDRATGSNRLAASTKLLAFFEGSEWSVMRNFLDSYTDYLDQQEAAKEDVSDGADVEKENDDEDKTEDENAVEMRSKDEDRSTKAAPTESANNYRFGVFIFKDDFGHSWYLHPSRALTSYGFEAGTHDFPTYVALLLDALRLRTPGSYSENADRVLRQMRYRIRKALQKASKLDLSKTQA
ncbi:hypothetical protein ACFL2D_01305 [Patescibacteria group bacterium]